MTSSCNCFTKISECISSTLEKIFENWAKILFKYSILVIIITTLLFFSLIWPYSKYEKQTNMLKLWVPRGCKALHDRDKIRDVFSSDTRRVMIYIESKSKDKNVISLEVFRTLIEFNEQLKTKVEHNGKHFDDLCFRSNERSQCEIYDNPLLFFEKADGEYDLSVVNSDEELLAWINSGKGYPELFPVNSSNIIDVKTMFGGTHPSHIETQTNGINNLQTAKAIQFTYFLSNEKESDEFFNSFEHNIDNFVGDFDSNNEYIHIYSYTMSSIARDFLKYSNEQKKVIYFGLGLIILYAFFTLGKLYTYNSRISVALGGVLGVFMAYIEALGLGTLIGIEGNSVVDLIPFILLGIGVDDMFVLLFCLDKAPHELSPKEKLEHMMKHAGVSITLTSLTNIFSFAIGSITSLIALRNFCIYAAIGLFFDYFNEITFFGAIVAIDIRRTAKEKGDCCGLIFCKPDSKACCYGKYSISPDGRFRESYMRKFFRNYYGPFILKKPVSIIIISVLIIGVNIYGTTQLEVDFNYEWLVDENYQVHDAIRLRDKYFDMGLPVSFYSINTDFSTQKNQKKLETLLVDINTCKGCDHNWVISNTASSWYTVYKNWVDEENCVLEGTKIYLTNNLVPETAFEPCLSIWYFSIESLPFQSYLAFNSNYSELIGSSMEAEMKKLDSATESIDAMHGTRDLADNGPGDSFPYNDAFLWYEHYAVFEKETILTVSTSLAAVFVIILLLLADLFGALIVLLIVSCTVLGELGLIYFWREELNAINIMNTIVAIGLSVDYSIHITHAFERVEGTKKERVISALDSAGVGVFNGGFTTFLAIIPLGTIDAYVFRNFFKCWFAIVVYGMIFGLVLCPIILSMIGSKSTDRSNRALLRDYEE